MYNMNILLNHIYNNLIVNNFNLLINLYIIFLINLDLINKITHIIKIMVNYEIILYNIFQIIDDFYYLILLNFLLIIYYHIQYYLIIF